MNDGQFHWQMKSRHCMFVWANWSFFWALNEKAMSQNVTERLWIRIIRIEALFEQIMRHMMFRVELC